MFLSRWLLKLPSLKLEFLLPLPLLLIAFGLGGELLTNQILSRSFNSPDKLQADNSPIDMQLSINALVSETEIEKEQDFTHVEVMMTNSVLKKLEFELPTTELSRVKTMLAEELGVSPKVENFQAGTQIKVQTSVDVLGIVAEIVKKQGFTIVKVETANSVLRRLEFELPVTELSMIKAAIAQELRLSPENVEMLVSYRLNN